MIKIKINNKEYKVDLADTDELKIKGLQGVTELPENQGMLFVYDDSEDMAYWMKDTSIPLDIIFIDEDWKVISVKQGEPESEDLIQESDVMYVLELNVDSGIEEGDDVDLDDLYEEVEDLDLKKTENDDKDSEEDEDEKQMMLVIGLKGKVQMELAGGERIFSRKNTKTLARIAKRAYKSKSEKDYKVLGRKLFEYLKIQDNKEEDYVELPENKKGE